MTNVLDNAQRNRLFWASCLALISTSVAFGVITESASELPDQYGLEGNQLGYVLGAAISGFAFAIILLGPAIDKIGIAVTIRMAFFCHLIGTLILMFSGSFVMAFLGASVIALGNGAVEAGCNPLVATLFPNNKTTKLNVFHVFWPVGIIVGAMFGYWISGVSAGVEGWSLFGLDALQAKLALILVPTLIYGYMFRNQIIPQTERVQSKVSDAQMWDAVKSPFFMLMLFCMMLTASLELGPNRWMRLAMGPSVESAFNVTDSGILVLVYGSALMAVLRFYAGGLVKRFAPTGILFASSILAGLGLYAMSGAQDPWMLIISATVFYVGVCFYWPTMLGVVAEQIPRTGAVGLCLMGGVGMLIAGYVTIPQIQSFAVGFEAVADANNPTAASLRASFQWVAVCAIPLALIVWMMQRRGCQGGYSTKAIASGSASQADPVQETAGV